MEERLDAERIACGKTALFNCVPNENANMPLKRGRDAVPQRKCDTSVSVTQRIRPQFTP